MQRRFRRAVRQGPRKRAFAGCRRRYGLAMNDSDARTEGQEDGVAAADIDAFIARWEESGGSELANFRTFAGELCRLLRLPEPEPSQSRKENNDYAFERRIDFRHEDGSTTPGRIDLYKRGCFVMEAKQSARRAGEKAADPRQPDMLPEDAARMRSGRRGWDRIMRAAKRRAEGYARALLRCFPVSRITDRFGTAKNARPSRQPPRQLP